ncbi:hypothetical protein HGP28_18675 [Vibrio sp. SM6]|uniref:MotA/TolQ/ExbB proton channel domain-containing protein n=1 Tax=Vibrio agarilyticus TaxID=2726741 RepID=A0A7X8TU67_9VIBR|nr:hypothetical protein [Vibrio agarilyticus]NLS14886.1 hypothetical protein [Vibrio agarilyticus]
MSEYLSGLIASVSANAFSDLFIYMIGAVFIFSLCLASLGKANGFVSGAPNLMTSLGILGTFAGIVVGLMEFDPQNIDGSISLLLSGLKTAFLTSLVGMCANIAFKAIEPFIRTKNVIAEGVGPDEIYSVMEQQLKVSQSLVDSIRGDEESSLASQVRLLRSDVNDGNKLVKNELSEINAHHKNTVESLSLMQTTHSAFSERLWNEMDKFGEMLSKSATEQVINALKEVIVDFNNNLTEQFGENFKRLDDSVKKLVDWQENYRQQLKEMAHTYQLGVDAIAYTEKSVAHISERTESIPKTMEKLHAVMELGHGQVTELEHRLDAFKELRDKAVEAMPEIQRQLDDTMTVISSSVSAASSHYETMLSESKAMIDSFSDEHQQATKQFTESTGLGIETMTSELGAALSNMNDSITKTLDESGNQLLSTVEGSMSKVTTSVESTCASFEQLINQTNETISDYSASAQETLIAANQHLESAKEETRIAMDDFASAHTSATKHFTESTAEGIQTINDGIESAVGTFITKVTETVDAVGRSLSESTESTIGHVSSTIEESVETFEKMNEASQLLVEQYGKSFSEALAEYSSTVQANLHTIKSELDAGAIAVSDELKQGAIEIGGKLAQSADEITSNVGNASGHLQSIVDHLTSQTEEIKEHLRLTMIDLNESVRGMVIDVKEKSAETIQILVKGNDELSENTQQTQQYMVQGIKELQDRLEGVLEEVFEAQVREVKRTFESLEEQVIDSVAQTGQAVEKQVEVLDLQMQQEINRVINEMGQGLATVTQQFTRDYGKLTNEMKTVVSSVTKLAS